MIAQLKVLANHKEIETAQEQYKNVANENHKIEESNKQLAKAKRADLLLLPQIPEPKYKNNDLLLDLIDVKLAFVNSTGEISIKYLGDNFNLVYSDDVWERLKTRFSE